MWTGPQCRAAAAGDDYVYEVMSEKPFPFAVLLGRVDVCFRAWGGEFERVGVPEACRSVWQLFRLSSFNKCIRWARGRGGCGGHRRLFGFFGRGTIVFYGDLTSRLSVLLCSSTVHGPSFVVTLTVCSFGAMTSHRKIYLSSNRLRVKESKADWTPSEDVWNARSALFLF